jgi:hypothetical protein
MLMGRKTTISLAALDGMSSPNSLLDNAGWKAAVTQFNDHFTQAEKEAGSALRPRLTSASSGDPSAVRLLIKTNNMWHRIQMVFLERLYSY